MLCKTFIQRVLVVVASFSFRVAYSAWPERCNTTVPLSTNEDVNHFQRNAAKINRSFQNRTALGVSWSVSEDDKKDLCGFTIHWYQNKNSSKANHIVVKDPSVSSHIVVDLEPGTQYSFYVLTYYATQHEPRSWMLTTFTDGCGPDVPDCNEKGSKGCNFTTGDCICKTTLTYGIFCDKCPEGYYLHNKGCITCDQCINDGIASNGTCTAAQDPEDTMTCNCFRPYTGKHCNECEEGYHFKHGICVPCICYQPKDQPTLKLTCSSSGKCNCTPDRTGNLCEKCAEGYTGNALKEGCVRSKNAGVIALIIIVVMIIILVLSITFYLICCRLCREKLISGFWNVHLREEYDKVNFTTLEEEPEVM